MQNPNSTGSDDSEQAAETARKHWPADSPPASSESGSAGFQPASKSGTAGVPPASGTAGVSPASNAAKPSESFKSILQKIGDFDSRYSPQDIVGSGSMGVVIKAQDIFLECDVAIKVLSSTQANADERRERFVREMRVLAALDHPNIVKIRSSGSTSKDYPFYVMDFLEGKSLAKMLIENQGLSVSVLKQVMPKVLDGLLYLHENKIVHRDLKPSNIVCIETSDENVVPKLIDFGIAIAQDDSSDRLTKTNVSVGSPAYMSPEQCRGGQVDERSDIYSFGCILYECISGRLPFAGESSLDVMYKQMNEAAPVLDSRSPEGAKLISVAMRCLEKNPENRPQCVTDLKQQFLSAIEDVDTVRLLNARSVVGLVRERRFLWISLVGVLTVAVILLLVGINTRREVPEVEKGLRLEASLVTTKSNDKIIKAAMRNARSLLNEISDIGRPVDARASLVEKIMERLLYLQREDTADKDLATLFGKVNLVLADLLNDVGKSNLDAVEKDAFKQEIVSARIPCLYFLGRMKIEPLPKVISELSDLSQYSRREFGDGSKQEIDALHTSVRLLIANGDFKAASPLLSLCFSKKQYDAVTIFAAQRRVLNLGPSADLPRGRGGQLILELHVETQNALARRKDLDGIEFCLVYIQGLQKIGQFDVANIVIPEVWTEIRKFPPSTRLDSTKKKLQNLEERNRDGFSKMKSIGNFPRINKKSKTVD